MNPADFPALHKNWAVFQLIENIGVRTILDKKISIPTQDGLEFIKTKDIIYCEGAEGYTKLYVGDKKSILSSKSIGFFNKMLGRKQFYLIHKSYLINLYHIEKYTNEGYIKLTGDYTVPVSRNKKTDFLNRIKEMD